MSDLDEATVKKLKVAELRSELQNRGLDTKGNKPVLVERLLEAISNVGQKNDNSLDEDGASAAEESAMEPQGQEEADEKKEETQMEENEENTVEDAESKVEEPLPVAENSCADQASDLETVDVPMEEKPTEESSGKPAESAEVLQKEESAIETEKDVAQSAEPMETGQESASTSQTTEGEKADAEKDADDDVEISTEARVEPEDEEIPLDDTLVVLDKYNSDLHLKIAADGLSGKPLEDEGFSYLLAGARATWGVTTGKVCFECKITAIASVELPDAEDPKNVVRVGWSTDSANLQLGEDKLSYGYDSSGKKATDSEFAEYGQIFGAEDVIGCYLDLESEPKTISFSKNGEDLGEAYELTDGLEDKALYPHVLIKNAEFSVNFGSQEEPWFPAKEGYTFMQSVGEEFLVHGTRGPTTKKECEVIMMVGLPGSGKTTWVNQQVSENPDKKYNVLGTNSIMEKMKIMGVARKRDVGGYSKLMDKAAKCLHRLFELAASKKRNYILDQTNVYLSAQKKKMRPFEGFNRKAIVCIPTQEDLKKRTEDRKKEGIELPENAVSDMKMSFTLPKVGEFFDEVVYADQPESKAKSVVDEYIKEGRSYRSRSGAGSEPPYKRSRFEDRPRHGGGYNRDRGFDDRGSYRRGGGGGGGGYNQRFGGRSYHGHGGGGGYHRGGRGGGGYHDRRDHRGGRGGGYGGGGYGGGGFRQQQSSYRQHQQSNQQQRPRYQQNYNQQNYNQQQQVSQASYTPQQQQQYNTSQAYNQYYNYNQGYQASTGYQQTGYAQQQPQQQQQQQTYGQTAQQQTYQNYQNYYAGYQQQQQQQQYGSYGSGSGY
ncbi:heterogeneous nuclear ribonucleoprotein U-like protein 1 isoform X2 [Pocillopora verrucosa]|uniref:heterogeneous nuclear ribonucleoprotein U-like protein 1 isoform X2 n=1 Tax=Pocillopora verrucosa TaxID=203993 RepID=UPI00334222DC